MKNNFKCAVAFFFLIFLNGTSIGNGQQGISYNGQVLPKVGRKSATASPKHKSLIVALMLNLGWSAPLLAIHC